VDQLNLPVAGESLAARVEAVVGGAVRQQTVLSLPPALHLCEGMQACKSAYAAHRVRKEPHTPLKV
jgi:hypothetical protein